MKVILSKDVQNLGHAGDVKEVSGGYAKNFLIPGGYARVATEGAMKKAEQLRAEREAQAKLDFEKAKELAARLQGQAVVIKAKAEEGKKLYAAVKPEEIAAALAAQGFEVGKDKISVDEPLKETGDFEVTVRLDHGLEVNVGVTIEGE